MRDIVILVRTPFSNYGTSYLFSITYSGYNSATNGLCYTDKCISTHYIDYCRNETQNELSFLYKYSKYLEQCSFCICCVS